MCCDHNTVRLPCLQPPPDPLLALFTGTDPQSKNFRDHIWEYNRALAFTSLGATEDHSVNIGRGPPIFRIQGELCHRSGSLLPPPGRPPTYAQPRYLADDENVGDSDTVHDLEPTTTFAIDACRPPFVHLTGVASDCQKEAGTFIIEVSCFKAAKANSEQESSKHVTRFFCSFGVIPRLTEVQKRETGTLEQAVCCCEH